MQRRAVVPHDDVARAPLVPVGEFVSRAMREELVQQSTGFGVGHAFDPDRETLVDVDALAAGIWVGANDRMHHVGSLGAALLADDDVAACELSFPQIAVP